MCLLVIVQRHMNSTHNSLLPDDSGQAEIATKVRLEMADGTNIALVQEDRGTQTGHNRAKPKGSRTLSSDYALRPMLAFIRKLDTVKNVGGDRCVNGDASNCCR